MWGNVHLLEAASVLSMIMCALYFVRPYRAFLVVSAGTALVLLLALGYIVSHYGLGGWYWERGWWHVGYYPGFSLFYTLVTWYASVLMRDVTIEEGIRELTSFSTIQIV